MRIAIIDYKIIKTNPIGGCHLRVIEALCKEHEFVVFAVEFENPCPDRVRFVRVPVPKRPLAFLFVAFHVVAPICYLLHRLRHRQRFDLIQSVESNSLIFPGVCYVQFCHRHFLKHYWPAVKGKGLRSVLRFWDHWLHALLEPVVYRRASALVVPSQGMREELAAEYPMLAEKLRVISNPVDLDAYALAPETDRDELRKKFGFSSSDLVMVFVALGHFERKGLPLIVGAMRALQNPALKLIVVGGEADLVSSYRQRVHEQGLEDKVYFAGMQRDTRPYLWASDVFVFPSAYETFSLVSFQAAAAGLPLLVSRLHGVEEFARDGVNSLIIDTTAEGVRSGIERFLAMSAVHRQAMGRRAQHDVSPYHVSRFDSNWRSFYARHPDAPPLATAHPDLDHRV
jgi:glycosyltransferase involved in cell wall biosynthesis